MGSSVENVPKVCRRCGGSGRVRTLEQHLLGEDAKVCEACGGKGIVWWTRIVWVDER